MFRLTILRTNFPPPHLKFCTSLSIQNMDSILILSTFRINGDVHDLKLKEKYYISLFSVRRNNVNYFTILRYFNITKYFFIYIFFFVFLNYDLILAFIIFHCLFASFFSFFFYKFSIKFFKVKFKLLSHPVA